MTESPPTFRILPATASDVDAIAAIATVCFPLPWPREELEQELRRPYATVRVLRITGDPRVVGFLDFWNVQGEVQIMNVGVLPELRGRGYGGALLADALRLASESGASFAVLEVRRSNDAAIRLYERHGFAPLGVRARYYSDNQEDALVMGRAL